MPKPSRGGQRTRWANAYAQNQPTQPPQDEDEDEDGIVVTKSADEDAEDAPKPQEIIEDEAKLKYEDVDWDNKQFPQLSSSEYTQVYRDNQASYNKNGNIVNAKKMYESPNAKPGTGGYSYSQDLNHRLNAGLPLDADSRFMSKYMTMGMHPIGKDCMLVRGAHDTLLNQILAKAGLKGGYESYSEAQIKTAIVGAEFQTKAFGSYGANDSKNPFIGGSQSGGRELIIHAETASSTKVIVGARAQEEFITGIGQNARVMDFKFSNDYAMPRGGGYKRVAHLYIRQW